MIRNRELFHLDMWDGLRGVSAHVASLVGAIALGPGEDDGDLASYLEFVEKETNGDLFDPVNLMKWCVSRSIAQLGASPAHLDEALEAVVRVQRAPYLTYHQEHGRMQLAKGSCPMCGLKPEFRAKSSYKGHDARFQVTKSCHHFRCQSVSGPGAARKADLWQGARWPYVNGERVATINGQPIDQALSTATQGTEAQA